MEQTKEFKTSLQWWNKTKASPETLNAWLKNQFHGEAIAATRIREHVLPYFTGKYAATVEKIAQDEEKHARWVGDLLLSRGITPEHLEKEEKYLQEVMVGDFMTDGNYAAAVAAHAEEMRLSRITAIMNDDEAPEDIREVFKKIFKDETFHAKAFKLIAGDEYYQKAATNHAKGLEALGLIV